MLLLPRSPPPPRLRPPSPPARAASPRKSGKGTAEIARTKRQTEGTFIEIKLTEAARRNKATPGHC